MYLTPFRGESDVSGARDGRRRTLPNVPFTALSRQGSLGARRFLNIIAVRHPCKDTGQPEHLDRRTQIEDLHTVITRPRYRRS